MLYALVSFSDQIGPLNVFRYITFRTGGAIMTALLFVFLFGPAIIDVLRVKQGKGHETGQIVGDKTLPFSDHDAVAAALSSRVA